MRFRGLTSNDPTREQYQLWIFDETGDMNFPVDGGVFNVSSSGELIIPIDPEVKVGKAVMFAVTRERPGGVPVSKREYISVLAKPA